MRDEIIAAAEKLTDPATGNKVVARAYRREELYSGPTVQSAADIILAPRDGYDPKGALAKDAFTYRDAMMVGMHTYDNAFLYVGRPGVPDRSANVLEVAPTILALMGLATPAELDKRSLV